MNDIFIKFEGNDVIIRGPKSILKISIDPTVTGIQRIIEPAGAFKPEKVKKSKRKPAKNVSKTKGKIKSLGKGKRVTEEIIDQIAYLRDDEKMTSKQIVEELGISLATINRHYRPLVNNRDI